MVLLYNFEILTVVSPVLENQFTLLYVTSKLETENMKMRLDLKHEKLSFSQSEENFSAH